MNIKNKLKENLFAEIIVIAYIVMFVLNSEMGIASVKNSWYYIKEMIMIMPVIFILTALLDMWIPKEKIIKYLGEKSKIKGILLSLVLGSISAGPIYAAFPFCVMLLKKGASIKNIVIILSSWAVIKVPMLLNEAKFLGLKFMVIRWILTIIVIIIFSYITDKIVNKKDIPIKNEERKTGIHLNKDACMGCSLCSKNYPELFYMKNKKACLKDNYIELDNTKLHYTIISCPVKAIDYVE